MKFDVKVPAYLYLREGADAQAIRDAQWGSPFRVVCPPLAFVVCTGVLCFLSLAAWGAITGEPHSGRQAAWALGCTGGLVMLVGLAGFTVWPQHDGMVLHSRGADARTLVTWRAGQRGFVTAPGTPLWRTLLWAALLTTRLVRWPLTAKDETLCS